ncbi:MAG: FMN-binding protein [Gammaproteobacteria bacterium]|nr:FMN-binding protein [Gammaproteobacteria bacterium]
MNCCVPLWRACAAAVLMAAAVLAQAEDYLSGEQFLASAFADTRPEQKTLWISNDMRQRAGIHRCGAVEACGCVTGAPVRAPPGAGADRQGAADNALGFVIEAERIVDVQVLSFRESRGWEIRYPFFTAQYRGVALREGRALSREVDGITGATLSVRAVNRAATLALWLNGQALASVATR